jgi:hypothetical protein
MHTTQGILAASLATLVFCAAPGCSTSEDGATRGLLRLALNADALGVTGVLVEVNCFDGTSVASYEPLEAEGLPRHVDAKQAGQPFSDLFSVLPVGSCTITATAMASPDSAAAHCEPANASVTLQAETTTEVLLTIQCEVVDAAPIDVIATLNHAPVFTSVMYSPDKTVFAGTPVTLVFGVEDPDGDEVSLSYELSAPEGAEFTQKATGNQFSLLALTAGTYTIVVTADDGQITTQESFEVTVKPKK